MDAQFFKAAIAGTQQTFQSMLGWTITPSHICMGELPHGAGEISALIEFNGRLSGTMVLTQQMSVAKKIASAMLQMDANGKIEETKDALGEILNMIIGAAKCTYDPKREPFTITLPSVMTGSDYWVDEFCDSKKISWAEFITEDGSTFNIRVHLH